uniref:PHD finger protein ING2 n=1 Tax=Rhizophora mucronata TaxID=61149 RepID=A0A2P2JW96_RHIMU
MITWSMQARYRPSFKGCSIPSENSMIGPSP